MFEDKYGKQDVKLRSRSIKFKNDFKQFALEGVQSNDNDNNASYTKKSKHQKVNHIKTYIFAYQVAHFDDEFSKPLVYHRGENAVNKFIEAILKEMKYFKKLMTNHFNKNLVMSVEDERILESSNWICNKLFAPEDNELKDHDHVTGKYRGSAHWNCNINLKLSKKAPAIFHYLKGYGSHLIMQEIGSFDVKISVEPNGLEKHTAFTNNENLVFIDSMQFMNCLADDKLLDRCDFFSF